MFDVWNFIVRIKACVHYFCFFDQNNSWKIIENDIILSKKFLLLSRFSNSCTSLFPLLFFFSSLGHYWFYGRSWLMINSIVYSIVISLRWILEHRFFNIRRASSDLDTWSIDRVLYRENFCGQIWLSQSQFWSNTLAGRYSHLLNVNHYTLSYMIERSLRTLTWSWVSKLGQPYN